MLIRRWAQTVSITFQTQRADGALVDSYREFAFPGGELHLSLPDPHDAPLERARITGCTSDDLVLLNLWADAVRQAGTACTVAQIPYLPAARADRGAPFGAKVYADLINAARVDEVVVFDPHSPVAPGLIHNVRIVEPTAAILEHVIPAGDYAAILAPDKGAVPRAAAVADEAGLPLYCATKTRDFATGKLSGFAAPDGLPKTGRVLIVDDICDGGGTFMGLAAVLGIPRARLDLWVSHGIFSGRAAQLGDAFQNIYTTDSHTGAHHPGVNANVIPLDPYLA